MPRGKHKALERTVELGVVEWAKRQGLVVTKMNLQGNRGMPDRCFWLNGGRPLLIEFKRSGETTTRLQQHQIDKLRELGYNVEIINNREAGIRCVASAMDAQAAPPKGRAIRAGALQRRSASRSRLG